VIAGVAKKKTQKTPKSLLDQCRGRLNQFDRDVKESE
jgi:phage-related protein